jgi:BCD family chlorophyll transporter-like MFS transporter
VQATAAGTAVALGGILRDIFATLAQRGVFGDSWAQPTTGYAFVYGLELLLLVLTLVVMRPLVRGRCPVRHAPAVGGVDNVPAGVR